MYVQIYRTIFIYSKMNSTGPDIIQPDFKLTGTHKFGDKTLEITTQRRLVRPKYIIDYNSVLTPSMQLNKPVLYWESLTLPSNETELFVATLGRKIYYDEVLVCLAVNIPDEFDANNRYVFHVLFEWHNQLYRRLSDIVTSVMKFTTGATGSRKHVYQYYFYSGRTPSANDDILQTIKKIQLPAPLNPNAKDFRDTLDKLSKDLLVLCDAEDTPVVDLLDLTIEQFNVMQKLLPRDSAWVKMRKERIAFFNNIQNEIDGILIAVNQLSTLRNRFDQLTLKYKNLTIKVEELQTLTEFQTKSTIQARTEKIITSTAPLNTFANLYNSTGTFKYRDQTLPHTSSLIKDLLTSQFLDFVQTFKKQHKKLLVESIGSKLVPEKVGLTEAFAYLQQFYVTTNAKKAYNDIIIYLTIYKLIDLIQTQNDQDKEISLQNIEGLRQQISDESVSGAISEYFANPSPEPIQRLLVSKIYDLHSLLDANVLQNLPNSKQLFEILYKTENNDDMTEVLTILSGVLPIEYAMRLHRFTKIIDNGNYRPILT